MSQASGQMGEGRAVPAEGTACREQRLAVPCICGIRKVRTGGKAVRPESLPQGVWPFPGRWQGPRVWFSAELGPGRGQERGDHFCDLESGGWAVGTGLEWSLRLGTHILRQLGQELGKEGDPAPRAWLARVSVTERQPKDVGFQQQEPDRVRGTGLAEAKKRTCLGKIGTGGFEGALGAPQARPENRSLEGDDGGSRREGEGAPGCAKPLLAAS